MVSPTHQIQGQLFQYMTSEITDKCLFHWKKYVKEVQKTSLHLLWEFPIVTTYSPPTLMPISCNFDWSNLHVVSVTSLSFKFSELTKNDWSHILKVLHSLATVLQICFCLQVRKVKIVNRKIKEMYFVVLISSWSHSKFSVCDRYQPSSFSICSNSGMRQK